MISSRHRVTVALTPIAALRGQTVARQDGTEGSGESGETTPTGEWAADAPEDHGFPADLSEQITSRVMSEAPLVTSLLVVRNGVMVVENYYHDATPDQPFHIWSITKSVSSIATGIAFREGLLTDVNQTLGELIPDRIPANADSRVPDITLYQLLTSTSGWEWDGRTNFRRHDETDDLDAMLARPLAWNPGEGFEYDSSNANLLSWVIQVQSGVTMAEYLQPRLFDSLEIASPEWIAMYQGETRGAGGLFLTPPDLAKIGQLFLQDGSWNGQEIVTPEWVAESTRGHASGTSSASGVNIGGGGEYGYQWWVKQPHGLDAYYGNGYGGQTLYMVPDLDLVVVVAVAGTDVTRPDLQQPVIPIIEDSIIPVAAG